MTASVKLGKYSESVGDFRVPEEDFYIMALDDWDEPRPSAYADKETGEYPLRINLKFSVVSDLQGDEEFKELICGKYVDLDLNPNRKGSIWHVLTALDPTMEPEPDMELESYRGKQLIGEVTHTTKPSRQDPKVMNTFANVGSIKPNKKKRTKAEPERELVGATAGRGNPLLANDDD